jgi:hypothetical protein
MEATEEEIETVPGFSRVLARRVLSHLGDRAHGGSVDAPSTPIDPLTPGGLTARRDPP